MLSNEAIPLLEDGFPENLFQNRLPCSFPVILSEEGSGGTCCFGFARLFFCSSSVPSDATFSDRIERTSDGIGSQDALLGISIAEGGVHESMKFGQVAYRCKEQDSEVVELYSRNDREEWLEGIVINDAEGGRLVSFLDTASPFIVVIDLALERKPGPRFCRKNGLDCVDRNSGEIGRGFDDEDFDLDESGVRPRG